MTTLSTAHMREFDPRPERATDESDSPLDVPTDAVVLGTDRLGATHFFSRGTETVTVVETPEVIDRYDLSSHSLLAWVTTTAQEWGWRDLSNAEMFVGILADSVGHP